MPLRKLFLYLAQASAQWAMIWTKLPWNQNPQMRSVIVRLRSVIVRWPGILVWHHSGPLKCPKKGWKPLKSAFLGTLEAPMLPKSIFFFNVHLLMSPECVSVSLAPFRALKMPKKGLKTTKKCLLGYSEASYVTQIYFFLQCASSYVSWMCIRCKIHHISALNHPRSPLGTFWTLKTALFGPLEQLTSVKGLLSNKIIFFIQNALK